METPASNQSMPDPRGSEQPPVQAPQAQPAPTAQLGQPVPVHAPGQPAPIDAAGDVAAVSAAPHPRHSWLPDLIVEIDQVTRNFGEVVGIDNISLHVPRGTVLGVIGPSGAGKTTTIRLISGALTPDSGQVRVLGEDPRRFRRRTRERIGYMPQMFVLYPDLTARENVEFMAALFGIPPWRRRGRIDDVLELVDLKEAQDRRASAMSGGMQRRLELACALVHQPSLLILDEPTAGIDPLLRTRIWQEIDRLRSEGVTILVTTQYVSEAEYCDAVALISEGQLIAHATPDELRRLALGGEVIEVGTRAPIDATTMPQVTGVMEVRQTGARSLLVIAEDAGLASPKINDAVEAIGGQVQFSREYRPTFDEVFAALVTAHAERLGTAEGQAAVQA